MVGGTGGTFKAELRHVLADDDGRVVGIHHNSGVRNGQRLDVDCSIVFEIRNGRITSGREHFYDLHGWERFWSYPSEARM
jgi:ketosteroid isomerase-like protein